MALKFDKQKFDKIFLKELENFHSEIDEKIIYYLNYLGMQLMKYAKEHKAFEDQTGNLVNSIGYAVLKKGIVTGVNFEAEKRGPQFNPAETPGELIGENLAYSVASQFPAEYTLLVIAGMNYASYVEDVHHLDVLTSAETYSREVFPRALKLITDSLKNYKS